MPFKFEKLKVWQKALDLADLVHCSTEGFPKEERYVLKSQMMRAVDSIALNIAEGSTGQSDAEFARFVSYAIRSCVEVVACLHLASRRKLINGNQFQELYSLCEEILVMLSSLRERLRSTSHRI